jgi:hypothetical protein
VASFQPRRLRRRRRKAAKSNEHTSGVLSAKAALAATAKKPLHLVATVGHGNLPFTGLALWMPMALGLGLIETGLAMRRKGQRPYVSSRAHQCNKEGRPQWPPLFCACVFFG